MINAYCHPFNIVKNAMFYCSHHNIHCFVHELLMHCDEIIVDQGNLCDCINSVNEKGIVLRAQNACMSVLNELEAGLRCQIEITKCYFPFQLCVTHL